ncbi:hypothetical protein [Inquilinus sp. Marseille-Q2685]|uniref:hypothetical protein n=1 Tax=Inquilinus sp. Marseille-Q2685 TaxID=2866581 RepID=UPI001CE45241|nr:hypothetical protein [Inquilinus sp. Marseille-Q2685]
MTIDKTEKYWVGTHPLDIKAYLRAYVESTPISAFRLAQCPCSSIDFRVEADADEGCVRRSCTRCSTAHFVCDSEEYGAEAELKPWRCKCRSDQANIGVGFSLHDNGDVRWLYVGLRCRKCGTLGCIADWKVGYGPSGHLLDAA